MTAIIYDLKTQSTYVPPNQWITLHRSALSTMKTDLSLFTKQSRSNVAVFFGMSKLFSPHTSALTTVIPIFRLSSAIADNVELTDGKLIINTEDRTEVELCNGEYILTVNGKRQKGSIEDQDIYYHLLRLAFEQYQPKILWQFSRSRFISVLRAIMVTSPYAFFGFSAIFVGVLSGNSVLIAFCSILALIFFFAACIAMMIGLNRITYRIYENHMSGGSFEYLPFGDVENAELKPSRIFKKRATIKLTAQGRKYHILLIPRADEAYELIRERINDKK